MDRTLRVFSHRDTLVMEISFVYDDEQPLAHILEYKRVQLEGDEGLESVVPLRLYVLPVDAPEISTVQQLLEFDQLFVAREAEENNGAEKPFRIEYEPHATARYLVKRQDKCIGIANLSHGLPEAEKQLSFMSALSVNRDGRGSYSPLEKNKSCIRKLLFGDEDGDEEIERVDLPRRALPEQ